MSDAISRGRALCVLAAIVALGAAFRFYNLGWGTPYYHFHIDEHFVLGPADTLRRDVEAAAMGAKFFMYSPMMMYLINIVRGVYEAVAHPLDLAVPADQVTYTILSRSLAATFGTATILLVYALAVRLAGRAAGLLAAMFLACSVLHLRDAHFATTDMPMVFFTTLAVWLAVRLAERGDWLSMIGAGVAVGAAVASKYTGLIALGAVGVGYALSPRRPRQWRPVGSWIRWAAVGVVPVIAAVATFFALDPLVLWYPDKFLADFQEQVSDPLTGISRRPIFFAQFADIGNLRLYWFTNLLWWSLGPALEIMGLAGVVWLIARRDRRAAVVAAFVLIYYAIAGQTVAPMIRYTLPLLPSLAVAAGVLSADWLSSGRWRPLARLSVGVTVVATALYAMAYMNVFRQPDARLSASQWLVENVPAGARILVEPSQNTPPMGSYYTDTHFYRDYVLWGGRVRSEAERERHDYYHLFTFDAYRYLYADRYDDAEKRRYIASRLSLVDWIVIDDTYVQWYERLKEPENAVVRQHYQDLLDEKLGFTLVKTWKVYPSLLGVPIRDERAEFTFRLFDHPRVYIFRRTAPRES